MALLALPFSGDWVTQTFNMPSCTAANLVAAGTGLGTDRKNRAVGDGVPGLAWKHDPED